MVELTATIKGAAHFATNMDRARKTEVKNLNTAIKVEGFRLMKKLKREISQGKPGGRPFAPISTLGAHTEAKRVYGKSQTAKFWAPGSMGRAKKKALRRLGSVVRYFVSSKDPFVFRVGWVGRLSKKWKDLARIHQEGFSRTVSDKKREEFAEMGGTFPRGDPRRKRFFIRETTSSFRTPARPIMDPFWTAYRDDAWRNIKTNWKRKMAGLRI